jgi:hypothetical protein
MRACSAAAAAAASAAISAGDFAGIAAVNGEKLEVAPQTCPFT